MKIYKIAKAKTIKDIANEERKKAIGVFSENGLGSNCHKVSKELKRALLQNGYETATIIRGNFKTDKPVKGEEIGQINKTLYDTEEQEQDVLYRLEHYWVNVDGLIVDITATQFNDLMDSPLPPVIIDSQDNPRYREIQELD
jgi:hypothetical protein